MLRITLPAALYLALYTVCSGANPLPLSNDFILAPLYTPPSNSDSALAFSTDSHIIRDSYIIVLKEETQLHEIDAHHALVASIHDAEFLTTTVEDQLAGIGHKYHVGKGKKGKKGFKGYSGKFSSSTVDAIRTLKEVKYVERDSIVWASEIEKGAPWVSGIAF